MAATRGCITSLGSAKSTSEPDGLRVASARPDVDLLLIGDGPFRDELDQQTRDLGLAERVRFLGVRSDIPRRGERVGAID